MNKYAWFIPILALFGLVACSNANPTPTTPPPIMVEQTGSGLYFIRVPGMDHNDVSYSGRVTRVGNCLRAIGEGQDDDENFLVLWPPGASVVEQGSEVHITGVHGMKAIEIGDYIFFNGNAYRQLPEQWQGLIPEECNQAPYVAPGAARPGAVPASP